MANSGDSLTGTTAGDGGSRSVNGGGGTLLEAMSPEFDSANAGSCHHHSRGDESLVDSSVQSTLGVAIENSDHLTRLLKHTALLRLALRASIDVAEDTSNRHTELIRHSGELSAAADRPLEEQAVSNRHAEEIGDPLQHCDAVDSVGVLVGVLFKGKSVVGGLAKLKVDDDDFQLVLDQN